MVAFYPMDCHYKMSELVSYPRYCYREEDDEQNSQNTVMLSAVSPNTVKQFVKPSMVKQLWNTCKKWFMNLMHKPQKINIDDVIDNAQVAVDAYDAYNKYQEQIAKNKPTQFVNYPA